MNTIRVRFAPSPTGMMHLGNVRTALINFLFAQQKKGTFVLRIEDTDAQRMADPEAQKILEDLAWLGLTYHEGPVIGGPHTPYYQSKREAIYKQKLQLLQDHNLVYRCFCTEQELAIKRERQQALKLPPRYDRTCLHLSEEKIHDAFARNTPFVWRFKLNHERSVTITDLSHGKITFELSNFSDFPLTRQDGSFTFMFANFVDDVAMEITHIFRGEDHLSNTANQAALFDALNLPLPTYWHMPILCNIEGKKLSKRDFGFSLRDLKDAGYPAQAVNNYAAIIGGSFKNEIMSLEELAQAFNFDAMSASGRITYDLEKLRWVSRNWINKLNTEELTRQCQSLLQTAFPQAKNLDTQTLVMLLTIIKPEMTTFNDVVPLLTFYFTRPMLTIEDIQACISEQSYSLIKDIMADNITTIAHPHEFAENTKRDAKNKNLPLKELFWFLRLAMMGKTHGPAIHELVTMLGTEEARTRIENALTLLNEATS